MFPHIEQKVSRVSKDHIGIYVPDTIIQKTDLNWNTKSSKKDWQVSKKA
ncbi:MAG: hypothetical protein ACE5J9_11460 [Methanosarcinales archaeon]